MSTVTMTARATAPALAQQEYAALLAALRTLPEGAWSAPTDCTGWTVWDIVAHIAGAAEESARFPSWRVTTGTPCFASGAGRSWTPSTTGRSRIALDGLRTSSSTSSTACRRERPEVASGCRRSCGGFLCPGRRAGCPATRWGTLNDVVYTRDIWMHRVDIARATGTTMSASAAEPDVVAQIVRDLSRASTGAPFELTVTGRVAGTWQVGSRQVGSRAEAPSPRSQPMRWPCAGPCLDAPR